MRNTKLAVLLAVYKNDNVIHLDEAIQSLLFQTINDFSIFILVDGPIPKPVKLCLAKYEAKLPLSADFVEEVTKDEAINFKLDGRKIKLIWMHIQKNRTYNI